MIEFTCGSCGKALTAPEKSHGRKGRCRHCGQIVEIGHQVKASPQIETEETGEEAIGQPTNKLPPFDFRPLLVVVLGAPAMTGVGLILDPTGRFRTRFVESVEWWERHGVGYWIIGIGFVGLAVRMIYAMWSWALDSGESRRDIFAVEKAAWSWFVESVHHTRAAAKVRAKAREDRREQDQARAATAAQQAREAEAVARAEAANPLMKCKDCGATISKRAAACPSCGAPLVVRPAKPAPIPRARPTYITVRPQMVAAPRRGGDALGCGCCFVLIGLLLCCLFPPLGFLFLIVGFVLVVLSFFI